MAKFTPVPVKPRVDGWTPELQCMFLEVLADTGIVSHAAAVVGKSPESAYRLRRREGAEAFSAAWEAAQAHATQILVDVAFARAIEGVSKPVYHKGEVIGERRQYSDALLMFLLRYKDPTRYGVFAKLMPINVGDIRAMDAAPLTELIEEIKEGGDAE